MNRLRKHLSTYGAQALSTTELIALIVSCGTPPADPLGVAYTILTTYGVRSLRTLDVHEFVAAGLSPAKATLLCAVCELAGRMSLPQPGEPPLQIRTDGEAATLLKPLMAHLDHEEFRVVGLDVKNNVVANLLLYQGTVDGSMVRIAEILRPAIVRKCPTILVAHNHPSGDSTPSDPDYGFTRQLVDAAGLLDIDVLDHLVIGHPGYTSLRERMKWK